MTTFDENYQKALRAAARKIAAGQEKPKSDLTPTHDFGNEKVDAEKRIGDRVVRRSQIIGSRAVYYSVYEPFTAELLHSTQMTIGGKRMGQLGSRRLPGTLDALPPYSEARSKAVGKFHNEQYALAHKLIVHAFPEAEIGHRLSSEITLNATRAR
jgi:hypothetical protein